MELFRQGVDDTPSGTPPMIGRRLTIEQWLDYLAHYRFGAVAPDRMVLHHTVVPTVRGWNGLATMRGMQRFYAGKGWRSSPHIYTAPDGIWLFAPLDRVGIHANSGNAGYGKGGRLLWYSIGVEMVGHYDRERPSGEVWEYTKTVLGSLALKFGRRPEAAISFHRDYTNQKSCPGWAVTKDWVFSEVNGWLRDFANPAQPVWEVEVTAIPHLRVRQGRGTDFPIAGQLPYGARVWVDDDTDGWLHLADGLGFIAKQFTRKL